MNDLLLTFTALLVLWSCIHLLARYYQQHRSILPLTYAKPSTYEFELKGVHARVSTTAFNALPVKLAGKGKRWLKAFYDLGIVSAVAGIALGLLWLVRWIVSVTSHATGGGSLAKRAFEEQDEYTMPFTFIIPGITVPLSHLPIILVAVFISQAYHEFGHALAATLEEIPISSIGISLILIFPSAFVSLPTSAMLESSKRAQARVISAGVWHNLSAWFIIYFFGASLVRGVITLGFREGEGKVVVWVDQESALGGVIGTGSVIKALDDSLDVWEDYLLGTQDVREGWCVPKDTFHSQEKCCEEGDGEMSCFVDMDSTKTKICVDPIPILRPSSPMLRCTTSSQCPSSSRCIKPDPSAHLLRIAVVYSSGAEDVVLWKGPRREVWEQVQVGKWHPRLWIIPLWIPGLLELFISYLEMALLSLYFVNLLPIPVLDGGQFVALGVRAWRTRGARVEVIAMEEGRMRA